MTNDQWTNDEGNPKPECRNRGLTGHCEIEVPPSGQHPLSHVLSMGESSLVLSHSFVIRHSSFVLSLFATLLLFALSSAYSQAATPDALFRQGLATYR